MALNRLQIIALAGLGAIDVVAALFAWRAFAGPGSSDDLPPRVAPAIIPASITSAASESPHEDSETLARPLFAKSRRPSQNAARATDDAATSPPPAGLKLLAVIAFGRSARAFVASGADTDGKWLSVGDVIESWRVDSIEAQDISLRQQDDRIRVGLNYDGGTGRVAQLPPPPVEKAEKRDEAPPAKIIAPESFAAVRDAKRGGH